MSDYFLNKIYDSLLSNKPVPKKPEPIVEKKKEAKTLQESYQLMYKKDTDPEFTKIEVDDVQFQKAYRYLQVTNTELQDAIKELRMSGLVQHHIQMIERLVFAHDNPKNFYNAIKNKVTIEELLQHADMVTFISNRYNLSREIVADLLSFVPPGTPSLGKGEVFFILFVQGAKKGKKVDEEASQSGDVVIGNNTYELKGIGARIKGQHNFGSYDTARETFEKELQVCIDKANLQLTTSGQNYNIQKDFNGYIDTIAPQLIQTGKVTKEDIVNVYANGFKQIYLKADLNEIKNWINKGLDNSGKMSPSPDDLNGFKMMYFKFALKYYTEQEDFQYMILLGTDPSQLGRRQKGGGRKGARYGMQKTISRTDIISGNIEGKILVKGWPSFSATTGQAGGTFGIQIAI
jgi:hypothetical protein